MTWFRLAWVEYPANTAAQFMADIPESTWPKFLSIEGDKPLNERGGFNVVYYSDYEMKNFINDFFFECLKDAIDFCVSDLGVDQTKINFLPNPKPLY